MENINIEKLFGIFKNTTTSYKFFFFKGYISLIKQQKKTASMETMLREMIKSSWFIVHYYNLSLGSSDQLYKIIKDISIENNITSKVEGSKVTNSLNKHQFKKSDFQFLKYVPYRLIANFFNFNEKEIGAKYYHLNIIKEANKEQKTFYSFKYESVINDNELIFNDQWSAFILANLPLIEGWVDFNLVQYLESKNPNVPNISKKLYLIFRSTLNNQRKLYKEILKTLTLKDIYIDKHKITNIDKEIDIDHFIPWTYVMHDNLWNLVPTNYSLNRSKSNNLPSKKYFDSYLEFQFQIFKYCIENNKKTYLEQYKLIYNNLDISAVKSGKYIIVECEFKENLKNVVDTMWETAKSNGFGVWGE